MIIISATSSELNCGDDCHDNRIIIINNVISPNNKMIFFSFKIVIMIILATSGKLNCEELGSLGCGKGRPGRNGCNCHRHHRQIKYNIIIFVAILIMALLTIIIITGQVRSIAITIIKLNITSSLLSPFIITWSPHRHDSNPHHHQLYYHRDSIQPQSTSSSSLSLSSSSS